MRWLNYWCICSSLQRSSGWKKNHCESQMLRVRKEKTGDWRTVYPLTSFLTPCSLCLQNRRLKPEICLPKDIFYFLYYLSPIPTTLFWCQGGLSHRKSTYPSNSVIIPTYQSFKSCTKDEGRHISMNKWFILLACSSDKSHIIWFY